MAPELYYIESEGTDPYLNIALEEQLLAGMEHSARVLYLWQNAKTVVIGRNQCAWRECSVEALRADGGTLARRLSGGGAVYHDLGNLNFTFLYPREEEDIPRQTGVVARAVGSFGLNAIQTGRNDIEIGGRKFSGNAFYASGGRAFHHGTVMIGVERRPLDRYLQVDPGKYQSKGVPSVRARVVNLAELLPGLTVNDMKKALRQAFEAEYGAVSAEVPGERLCREEIERRRERFADWKWVYGQPIAFTWAGENRFGWGSLRAELKVSGGDIADCRFYSDAMSTGIFERAAELLAGCPFDRETVRKRMEPLGGAPEHLDMLSLIDGSFA